ncbi:MAG: MotA/TolQ/ExbB proton channel family protein [Opitutales bacterium]
MNFEPEGWAQIWDTWQKGGTLMIPLLLLSVYAYYVGFELFFHLRQMLPRNRKGLRSSPATMIREPEAVDGVLGEILVECMATGNDREETRRRFRQVRSESGKTLNRRIRFLVALIASAPLLGLLGTVDGMLATFRGLTVEVGRKMDLVAGGISEALITTQTGLMIAIPAYVLLHLVLRRKTEWLHLLRLLESHATRKMAASKPSS